MSLGFNYRASVYSTSGAASYATTGTYTPAANSLLVAFVVNSLASSPLDPTSVSGHGVSFTKLTLSARTFGTTHNISVWIANSGASPTSAAVTADFNGVSQTGCAIIEYEITGADLTTLAGSVVQNPTNTGTGTSGSVTLSAAGASPNRPLAFFVHQANEVTTPRTNWTEPASSDGNFNNPATGAEAQYRSDAFETTASATWSSSVVWRGVALEIKAAPISLNGTPAGAASIATTMTHTDKMTGTPAGDSSITTAMTHTVKLGGTPAGGSSETSVLSLTKLLGSNISTGGVCSGTLTVSNITTHSLSGTPAGAAVARGYLFWNPLKLGSTLRGWYKAGLINGLSNNDPVATWADFSGNGKDGTQGTSGNKPQFKTGRQNGQPSVYFDGTDDYLDTTITDTFGDFTAIVIVKGANVGIVWVNGHCRVLCKSYSGGFFISNSSTNAGETGVTDREHFKAGIEETSSPYGTTLLGAYDITAKAMLFEVRRNGTTKIERANGREFETTATVSNAATDATAMRIGYPVAGEGNNAWGGDIFEIIICNSNLSDADLKNIYDYANAEYALWVGLTGTPIGAGTASGSLTVTGGATTVNLSGTPAGAAVANGNITLIHSLTGTPNGAASITETLTLSKNPSGTPTGVGTSSGNFRVTFRAFGSPSGTGVLTGNLLANYKLSGASNGVASEAYTLTVIHSLSGTPSGAASISSTLTNVHLLSGNPVGVASLSSTLTVQKLLQGNITGAASLSSTLSHTVRLSASIAGAGVLNGSLNVSSGLSGSPLGTSTATATFHATYKFTGSATGTATLSEVLTLTHDLAGTPAGQGTATGSLSTTHVTVNLSGSAVGAASIASTLRVTKSLSGICNGTASNSSNFRVTKSLYGSPNGASLGNGIFKVQYRLRSTINAASFSTGTLSQTVSLGGAINAPATCVGAMSVYAFGITNKTYVELLSGKATITFPQGGFTQADYLTVDNGKKQLDFPDNGRTRLEK